MLESLHELLSYASISREGDTLILRTATLSRLLWCCVPLLAAMLGAAGLLFVRHHRRRANPPSPAATPVTIFSVAALVFAIVLSVFLVPAVFCTEIRITPTEATQDVGLWWDKRVRRFAYGEIESITVTSGRGDFGSEPLWQIAWCGGGTEVFDPGDLWSVNQQVIIETMQRHGVQLADRRDSR